MIVNLVHLGTFDIKINKNKEKNHGQNGKQPR
jgi:hypothetical protein